MEEATQTQAVRLKNLRSLHVRPGGEGAPTSDFFVHFLNKKGVSISKNELSETYWKRRSISDNLASGIERAFDLPSGWLSEDHEFLYKLNPGEIAALRGLSGLPDKVKSSLLSLVTAIAAQQAKVSAPEPGV